MEMFWMTGYLAIVSSVSPSAVGAKIKKSDQPHLGSWNIVSFCFQLISKPVLKCQLVLKYKPKVSNIFK